MSTRFYSLNFSLILLAAFFIPSLASADPLALRSGGSNTPIYASFTTPDADNNNGSSSNNLVYDTNGFGDNTNSAATSLSLGSGAAVQGNFQAPGGQIGYFTLDDTGNFYLEIDQALAGGFTLTLSSLIPDDGSSVSGFTVNGFSGSFLSDTTFSLTDGGQTATLTFSSDVTAGSYLNGTFSAAVVPEPATSALLLATAVGVIAFVRRRRSC